jgi:hypothetical protein
MSEKCQTQTFAGHAFALLTRKAYTMAGQEPGAAESPLWVNLRRTQREHIPSGSPADNRHQRALSAAAAPAILPMEAQTPVTRAPPAPKEAP